MFNRRHSYPRRKYRLRLKHFLRANRGRFLVVALGFAVVGAIESWSFHGYLLGAIHATLVVGFIAMMLTSFHASTGSVWQIAGAWGEDNTADELLKARRRKLICGWVDSIELDRSDIDHMVVLRDGTVLAIDSKWRTAVTPATCRGDVAAAERTALHARSVMRHHGRPARVTPLVVVWGGGQSDLPAGHVTVDGVDVVSGHHLRAWLREHCAGTERSVSAPEILAELRDFKRTLDRYAAQHRERDNVSA